jgi:hypothetical protein
MAELVARPPGLSAFQVLAELPERVSSVRSMTLYRVIAR